MSKITPTKSNRVTINDIARLSGVSRGAVSFALNGAAGVSEETRARIIAVADSLNWRPSSAARALGARKTDTIGLMIARPARTLGLEPFFAQILSGIQQELSTKRIALHLMIVEDLNTELAEYRRWWSERRVDGVILMDIREDDPRIQLIEELHIPAVAVGGAGSHGSIPAVWADDRDAMQSIIEYLAAMGHRSIAHVAGLPSFVHTRHRIETLAAARTTLNLTRAESLTTDFSDSEGAAITRRLLSRAERPHAIIYDSDVMAMAGLNVAQEMGLSLPEKLSIVSFDDSLLTQLVFPGITALSRDTFLLGELVAQTLIQIVNGEETNLDIPAPLPKLVVRGSTGPAATHQP